VCWADRLREAVLRHHREPMAASLVERHIGRDHRYRRICAGGAWRTCGEILRIEPIVRQQWLHVDLAGQCQLGCPEPAAIRPHNAAPAVYRDKRADRGAACEAQRRAARAAFQPAGFGAETGAGIAERKLLSRVLEREPAEAAMGRLSGPVLPPGKSEVE